MHTDRSLKINVISNNLIVVPAVSFSWPVNVFIDGTFLEIWKITLRVSPRKIKVWKTLLHTNVVFFFHCSYMDPSGIWFLPLAFPSGVKFLSCWYCILTVRCCEVILNTAAQPSNYSPLTERFLSDVLVGWSHNIRLWSHQMTIYLVGLFNCCCYATSWPVILL
jgi:hypothetical protein